MFSFGRRGLKSAARVRGYCMYRNPVNTDEFYSYMVTIILDYPFLEFQDVIKHHPKSSVVLDRKGGHRRY
ncbi:Uncharacterised protein [uncultured archaeon]|nr:Uncharacterised protein [uncultured archaeon]